MREEFGWIYRALDAAGATANAHCDSLVLHKPGECFYCDKYPETQARRRELRIPFAGAVGAPETLFRADETVRRWSGNVAVRKGELHSHLGATYIVGKE